MQNPQVDRSRPDANERSADSARRAAAPTKPGLPRDWPPAAKVRGELARAVGFSRRQFEGRSGPAGSVALALLMAPARATSPAGEGVTRWTFTDRANGAAARDQRSGAQAATAREAVESAAVKRANRDSAPLAVAEGAVAGERSSERRSAIRLPRAASTPESACAHEQAETPRWTRPLVDRALTAVASTTHPIDAVSHSDLGAPRWHEQSPLSWQPAGATDRGRDVGRNASSDRRDGALTSTRTCLQATLQQTLRFALRDTVANQLRRAPQTALSRARRAFASCEHLFASVWPNFEAGTAVRRPAERAEFVGKSGSTRGPTRGLVTGLVTGGAVRGQADAPVNSDSGTAIATSAELATSEWASAAVFTSLLALLFLL